MLSASEGDGKRERERVEERARWREQVKRRGRKGEL